jgi:hypothetical protein
MAEEDYSKYSNEELLKMLENAEQQAQTYHVSQLVKKVLLNSLYGALGNEHFLLYTNEMARSITLMGQCLINKAAIEKNRFISKMLKEEVVKDRRTYSDTDSCLGDTLISVNGRKETIEDFYNSSEGDEVETIFGKYVKELPKGKYKTLSIDEDDLSKVKEVDILHAVKHKTPKRMWKVKVDGKEVIITEDHSIMILRDGYLMRGSVRDIREGDEILTIDLNKE